MDDALPQLPKIGDLVAGRFRIVSLLGTGGFGTVYRALQENIGRDVALKFLTPGIAKDPVNVERFRREAFHVSQLRHPNTITVYDYGQTEDGLIYMVMEILEGISLADSIQDEGAIAWPRASHIFIQILKSLSEAHRRGLVHRDLKPENIYLCELFGEQDYVKVLDFGVAKMTLESDDDSEMKLTKAGRIFGTPMYMAPEQACAEPITPATDVYALGLLIFEMLTGHPPVTGRNRIDVIHKQIRDEVPILTKEMIGTAMGSFIRKATEKKPSERYHDAAEMLDGYLDTLHELNIRPSAKGATRPEISISSLVPEMSAIEEIEMELSPEDEQADDVTKAYPSDIELEKLVKSPIKVMDNDAFPTTEYNALSEKLIKQEKEKQKTFAERPHSKPRYEVPLVGRSNEINALGSFIANNLRIHDGVIALIDGENGLGKTRLVKSLADHFKRIGIDSSMGKCNARSPALEPIREALRGFWGLKQSDRTQVHRTIFGDFSTLGLTAETEAIVRFLHPESNSDPSMNNSGALLASLERVLIKLCERKPLVLIIEDLQYADSAALEFIEYLSLTMQTQSVRFAILLTMRPDAPVINPNIDSTFRKLTDRLGDRFTRSKLRRLSGRRLVKLLDAILPLEQRLKERVGWLCQGVPLHAIQIIRYLQNEGQLKRIDDPRRDLWTLQVGSPRDINLPPDLMELMRLRVEQAIDGESQAVLRGLLEWLATLGMRTPVDLLRSVLKENQNLESDLGKLRDEGIVRQSMHHNLVCVEFDSSLLREGILRSLSERWESRRLHKDAAEAKTVFYQQRNIPIPLVEIAEHWRQAGESELYREAILASAQRSMSQRNLRGARDQFRELIDLLDRSQIKNESWIQAHIASGELAWRFGEFGRAEDHYRHAVNEGKGIELVRAIRGLGHLLTIQSKFEEAHLCFERALGLSQEHSDNPSVAKALVGISKINIRSGDLVKNEPIVRRLEDMLVTLPTGEIAGKVLLHLSQLAQRQGKLGKRYKYLVQARHHFEDARDKFGLSDVLFRLGGALSDPANNAPDRYLEGKKVLKQALELKQELGDRFGVAETYRYSGQLELQFEHYDLANQLLNQALTLHKALGVPLNIGATYMAIGINKMFQSNFEEARENQEEALALFKKIGDTVAAAHALMNLGELAINEGDIERAQELLKDAQKEKESVGSHWAVIDIQNHLAICAMWKGDYPEAEVLLNLSLQEVDEKGTEEDRAIARSLLGLLWCFQGRLQLGALELGRSRADAEDLGINKVSVFCQANAAFYAAITEDELTFDHLVESVKSQPFFYTLSRPTWLGLISQLARNAETHESKAWAKKLIHATKRFATNFENVDAQSSLQSTLSSLENP